MRRALSAAARGYCPTGIGGRGASSAGTGLSLRSISGSFLMAEARSGASFGLLASAGVGGSGGGSCLNGGNRPRFYLDCGQRVGLDRNLRRRSRQWRLRIRGTRG